MVQVLPSSSPSDDNEIDIMDLGEFQHLFEHKNFQAVLGVTNYIFSLKGALP